MIEVTSVEQFDNLSTGSLVIADFYAPWCTNCKVTGVILKQLEEQYPERVVLGVNIESEAGLKIAQKYSVTNLPTLLLIHDQVVVSRRSGGSKSQLETLFIEHVV